MFCKVTKEEAMVIYVDGVRRGGLDELRALAIEQVQELRFLSAEEATSRFGMGHPFGASGIRMLHETVTQLRGTAGARQVSRARAGLVQCSGAGGVCSVIIASR